MVFVLWITLVFTFVNIVTWWQKARIVEWIPAAIARQWHDKHVSAAMNKHATIKELLVAAFCTWSVLRLYNRNKQEKLVSCESEVGVSGLTVWSCSVSSHYLATICEQKEDFMCAVVVMVHTVCNSYKLEAFNKLNYQSKSRVLLLTCCWILKE
jgi:hypothetical protein